MPTHYVEKCTFKIPQKPYSFLTEDATQSYGK